MDSENAEAERLLSNNEMVQWLYSFLRSEDISSLPIKISELDQGDLHYYCFRCSIVQEYINEMKMRIKVAVLSTVHDSILVFINHFLINARPNEISKRDFDGIWKDIICRAIRHEQKTAVDIPRGAFGDFVKSYLKEVIEQIENKDVWWFVTLYKVPEWKLPKDIKPPLCSYYLVCMSLNAKAANLEQLKTKKDITERAEQMSQQINEDQEQFLRQVEREDGFEEGLFYPVKNTLVVDKLRSDVLKLEEVAALLQEDNKQLKEDNKQLKEDNKQLKEDNKQLKALIEKLQSEIEQLKKSK